MKRNDKGSLGGQVTTPGDPLAVMEEFLPGQGAYVDEEAGLVRASLTGTVVRDLFLKVIGVRAPRQKYVFPVNGSIVIGFVASMRSDFALITLISDGKMRPLSSPLTGILHVSQAGSGFVKSMYDILGIGDLVKTKIISSENPFQLSMKSPGLGVILSTCSKCGAVLRRSRSGGLVCPKCGNTETRLIAPDYIDLRRVV